MQHGQKIKDQPKDLLKKAGFNVVDVPEGHLCCGSAGTYNILQSEIAGKLKARKIANIERIKPDLIATGNIGCITQIGGGTGIPIIHTVELLNWAYGGSKPQKLVNIGFEGSRPTSSLRCRLPNNTQLAPAEQIGTLKNPLKASLQRVCCFESGNSNQSVLKIEANGLLAPLMY